MKKTSSPSLQPIDLRCEFQRNPLSIGVRNPRLSWRFRGAPENASQKAWQVQAAATERDLRNGNFIWDSGKVAEAEQLDRVYGGPALKPRERVVWRVRVWDEKSRASNWSAAASFEAGLFNKSDFKAEWIARAAKGASDAVPMFRAKFDVAKTVAKARLYLSARGVCEMSINGQRVGGDWFAPGWTEYAKRIYVCAYDVKPLLAKGANVIGGIVSAGWYAGRSGWRNRREIYGEKTALWAQLEIEFTDGTTETIMTNNTWQTGLGPWRTADFYDGENYDASAEVPGWDTVEGWGSLRWKNAAVLDAPRAGVLLMREAPAVREQEILTAKKVHSVEKDAWIYDLGQNMVGVQRVRLANTKPGQKITFQFAEMLKADKSLYTENYRTAKVVDTYICKGGKEEIYQPRFTFRGFRYIGVKGIQKAPKCTDVQGVVLHSEMEKTGAFECSDALVNRLASNIIWGQRGNFFEVPTDCPQRDERLGWTGDAQVFVRTAAWNYDVALFFEKWMRDMAAAQRGDGAVSHVVPNTLGENAFGSTAWADAAVICPWTMYRCYGDTEILRESWNMMAKWMGYREKHTEKSGVSTVLGFGDWLAIDMVNPKDPGSAKTPKNLIGTAYHAHLAGLMEQIAAILGRTKDAARYAAMRKRVTAAFQHAFLDEKTGDLAEQTQTAYLLALGFDLLPQKFVKRIGDRLVAKIEEWGDHLSTGFVGTPLLGPVLTKIGRTDVAYRLLFQKTYPSWLFPIADGDATTMWERWNSYSSKDGFGDVGMNSFNHYAYGAIGEWMYNTVLGIELDPAVPGYRRFIVKPEFSPKLDWVKGSLETRYGPIEMSWKRGAGKRVNITLRVPPATTATVIQRGKKVKTLASGTHRFSLTDEA